jgi:hypothetical protein
MKVESKIIRDPIHGDIKFKGLFLDLIEAPEIQRLSNIRQLGFAQLVFPGAHHTRLEHSFGSYYLAFQVAEKLNLDEDEKEMLACAAILHDIGHGPFSHTLEYILRDTLNIDHIDLTEKLILGELCMFENEEKGFIDSHRVFDILNQYNINQREISNLVRGKICEKQYLNQLLNSSIDVDQLDYIIRDSYYTGVAFGLIDIERYLQTLVLHDENLAIMRKGVGVVENILMARTLMYSSVYFHKTVRIAELMLSKAIEMIDNAEAFEFFKMTDAELINYLRNRGDFQREIATRLKYRKLFKQGYVESGIGLAEGKLEIIKKLDDARFRRKKEQEFEETLSIPRGHVIIDVPYTELHLSEPRIDQTNILIIDGNRTKTLDEYTPVGNAVKSRAIPDWIIMIITDDKYRAIVADKAERILFE